MPPSQPPEGPGGMSGPPGPGGDPHKPAFPAYQNAEQPMGLSEAPARQASKIPPVGAGCKLMHPEDDLSLVRGVIIVGVYQPPARTHTHTQKMKTTRLPFLIHASSWLRL